MLYRLFHSWWTAVAVLLLVAICITAVQAKPKTQLSSNNTPSTDNGSTQSISYGVAMGGTLNGIDNRKRVAILTQIKKAGFDTVRLNLDWVNTESAQGKYNWVGDDALMQAVKSSGLKPIILIDRAPVWARLAVCKADPVCSPQNATDYARFAGVAANRYKAYDIKAWEVWNEQNSNNFWKPLPNPNQYAQLLTAANNSIKKVNPKATVLIGGLSGDSVDKLGANIVDPRTYLAQLYAANAGGHFDGVAYHPYIAGIGFPDKKSDYNGWSKMANGDNNIRSQMVENGDASKGIWITEFGVPTGGKGAVVTDPSKIPSGADHVTYDAQVQIVQAALDNLKGKTWVRAFDWYGYKDDTTAATYSGAAYGLWQSNGKPKPVLTTIQDSMKNN